MLTPGLKVIQNIYNVPAGVVSTFMVGALTLFAGLATFFTAAGANIWGKRPCFLYSTAVLLITAFWGLAASVSSLVTFSRFDKWEV